MSRPAPGLPGMRKAIVAAATAGLGFLAAGQADGLSGRELVGAAIAAGLGGLATYGIKNAEVE